MGSLRKLGRNGTLENRLEEKLSTEGIRFAVSDGESDSTMVEFQSTEKTFEADLKKAFDELMDQVTGKCFVVYMYYDAVGWGELEESSWQEFQSVIENLDSLWKRAVKEKQKE